MKFSIGDKVKIPDLENQRGNIKCIYLTKHGTEYCVRYFLNGKLEEVYLLEDEMVEVE